MKKLKFNINDDIYGAFNTFCKEYNTTPEDAIENLINLYGWAQLAWQGLRKGEVTKEDAIILLKNMVTYGKKLCGYNHLPMQFPLYYTLQRDLIKCLTIRGYRAEPSSM
jgi:hypothetical protein